MDPDAVGMVSGVGRGIDVLDGGGCRRRGRDSFWVEFGRPVVTNGYFATRLVVNVTSLTARY